MKFADTAKIVIIVIALATVDALAATYSITNNSDHNIYIGNKLIGPLSSEPCQSTSLAPNTSTTCTGFNRGALWVCNTQNAWECSVSTNMIRLIYLRNTPYPLRSYCGNQPLKLGPGSCSPQDSNLTIAYNFSNNIFSATVTGSSQTLTPIVTE